MNPQVLVAVQSSNTPSKTHTTTTQVFLYMSLNPNLSMQPPPNIMNHEPETDHITTRDYFHHDDQTFLSDTGCSCFRLFNYFGSRHSDRETTAFIYHGPGDVDNDGWLMNRLKNMKEFSEIVAGPKWKNFIRKFSKKPKTGSSRLQYDPEGYALNFSDGGDDGLLPCSFSMRFAPPSRSIVN